MSGAAAVRVLARPGEERGGTVKTSKWLLVALCVAGLIVAACGGGDNGGGGGGGGGGGY